ncbi:PROTEINASE INHIBITOR I4 SERPIN (DUF716)-RELATED [Salix koriyanagi]|uniref:PROTEINASE INHIBITOR I4 SERPIN (DUF716)-RELATED n=1 Tax=Salix koriyanagi TaxID=2511006 RepID=A0A9Q0Q9R1_9ROSI|nr:PROTEINASE INHIBITOR I4 SERPIN (DUF716)-RELATED [Salix koriyanagi]
MVPYHKTRVSRALFDHVRKLHFHFNGTWNSSLGQQNTIPSMLMEPYHLRNFEHSFISMSFFVCATFALLLDRTGAKSKCDQLMGLGFPGSFLVSFARSLSVLFQGVWFIIMGSML